MNTSSLAALLQGSFTLVLIAFVAGALFLYLEKDRVPEQFRTAIRVSIVYLTIAAFNYYYMRATYADAIAAGATRFPTQYRYIDWIMTTPLMLLEFPLLLGVGRKGRAFMGRLVFLDLIMVVAGFIGELHPDNPLIHHGLFMVGCFAWLLILGLLFQALTMLPERVGPALRDGVRTMGAFVVVGWAIYPLGYMAPLLGLPPHVREVVYNFADIVNKIGLCLVVYATAKQTGLDEARANEAGETDAADEEDDGK